MLKFLRAVLVVIFLIGAMIGAIMMTGCNREETPEDIRLMGRGDEPQATPGTASEGTTPAPTPAAPLAAPPYNPQNLRPITPAPRPEPTPGVPPERRFMPSPEELLEQKPVPLQFTPLTPGEELAVLHTNHGDIILRLFPQAAPLAVENFLTHAVNGFYDGLIFHRVWENFMIQGGCALGTGRGGESIWGTGFGPEHNYDLWHFNGALATAQTGMANSIGSQFYIVHRGHLEGGFDREFEEILNHLDNVIYPEDWDGESPHIRLGDIYPREMLEHYLRVGGTPHLDFPFNSQGPNFGHTVFGHVVTGMDVVNSIASVPVDGDHRPLTNVIIERVSFVVYEG